jgi:predicted lipoprotein with Yx(FWY)xxD motif
LAVGGGQAAARAGARRLRAGVRAASSGVTASDLGTISRSDGTKQVTYGGHPLYYYSRDTGAGQTNGEGLTAFGAAWYLLAPSGQQVTSLAGAAAPSGGGGGGY